MNNIVGTEHYGSLSGSRVYAAPGNGDLQRVDKLGGLSQGRLGQFFRSVFLPAGYPESVSGDYLEYQIWDTVQAFASTVTHSFATQSVLRGFGVGDESASLLAATITWLMKDGFGKLGRIIFAWYQGTHLDCDSKKWRFFADVLYDVSIFLEIVAALYKEAFFILMCLSGIFVAIVGVAGSATRAALTQHQARRNNLADVSAKDGSQETLVNMMGLLISLILAPVVSGNMPLTWLLFTVLTLVHVYANWRSMKAVTMETFNQARFHYVAQSYFSSPDGSIISIRQANLREPILGKLKRKLDIKFGCSLGETLKSYRDLRAITSIYSGTKFLLYIQPQTRTVSVILHDEATAMDELEAMFEAELLNYSFTTAYASQSHVRLQIAPLTQAIFNADIMEMLTHSRKLSSAVFPHFLSVLKDDGWTTSHTLLNADEWRATWQQA